MKGRKKFAFDQDIQTHKKIVKYCKDNDLVAAQIYRQITKEWIEKHSI